MMVMWMRLDCEAQALEFKRLNETLIAVRESLESMNLRLQAIEKRSRFLVVEIRGVKFPHHRWMTWRMIMIMWRRNMIVQLMLPTEEEEAVEVSVEEEEECGINILLLGEEGMMTF